MTRVKLNIIANFLGQGWIYLLQLGLVPIFLAALGAEAYGLVGLFGMLYTAAMLFDLGIGQTVSREAARWSSTGSGSATPRSLLATFLPLYAALGGLVAGLIYALAPWIGTHVIDTRALPPAVAIDSIRIMALAVAFQWLQGIFLGLLAGLQRQIAANLFRAAFSTASGLGAVAVLALGTPGPQALFSWYALASGVGLLAAAVLCRATLPHDARDHGFRLAVLRPIWRFALGSSLIGAIGVVLGQADKWIVLSISRLEDFTHYSIAAAAAMALYGIAQPVLGALFPRMNALVAKQDEDTLRGVYHASTQLVAALSFSMGLCLAMFSREALLLWTRNASVAVGAAPIATVLVLGTMLNCAMFVPYNLQLAYGWTRLSLYISSVFLIVLVPAGYVLGSRYGPIGCAAVWLALNAGYFCAGVWLTHRKILRGEAMAWYVRDTLPCLLCALLVTGACRMLFPTAASPWVQMALLFLIGVLTLGACLFAVPQPRGWLLDRAARVRRRMFRPRQPS